MGSALNRSYLRSRAAVAGTTILFISLAGALLSWLPLREQAIYDEYASQYVHLAYEVSIVAAEGVRLAYDPWPERRQVARERLEEALQEIAVDLFKLSSLKTRSRGESDFFSLKVSEKVFALWVGEPDESGRASGVSDEVSELIADTQRLLAYPNDKRFRARELALQISDHAEGQLAPSLEAIAQEVQRLRRDRINALLKIVIGSFAAIVLATVMIGLAIFRPMEKTILATQADLSLAKDRAESADRAKSAFLAAMSHEIRTPLNGVLGMTQSLLEEPLTPRQRDHLQIIKESGGTLLNLLNDILDLSKIEAGQVTTEERTFSLKRLIAHAEALWQSRASSKGLSFEFVDQAPDLDLVIGDSAKLTQVLNNLLGNAVKFTERGGITLILALRSDDEGPGFVITVRDTGIGLSPEQSGKLFKPFVQADTSTTRRFGGTGLGLVISKQLVEALGGHIGMESKLGVGTSVTFSVSMPVGQACDLPREDEIGAHAISPRRGEGPAPRILLADDNHINQRVVASFLAPLDCELEIVSDGRAAVEAAEQGRFELILMDVQMPELDGPSATQAIRGHPDPAVAKLPIVALTANAMKGDRERYLAAGMDDYVSKPIDAQQLRATVCHWLGLEIEMAAEPPEAEAEAAPEEEPARNDAMEALLAKVKAQG